MRPGEALDALVRMVGGDWGTKALLLELLALFELVTAVFGGVRGGVGLDAFGLGSVAIIVIGLGDATILFCFVAFLDISQ
mmetsp:Transcript_46274/g.97241  ORF Transcript_46274/g.97241 Transcript_46274/m.97241 type:complete len:80 (-) Transcript_46274:124-363(-)